MRTWFTRALNRCAPRTNHAQPVFDTPWFATVELSATVESQTTDEFDRKRIVLRANVSGNRRVRCLSLTAKIDHDQTRSGPEPLILPSDELKFWSIRIRCELMFAHFSVGRFFGSSSNPGFRIVFESGFAATAAHPVRFSLVRNRNGAQSLRNDTRFFAVVRITQSK